MDGSEERRGRPSVHVCWDVPTAVLVGDFLLSKAMLLMASLDDLPLLREMLDTALSMCEGELMQRKRQETNDYQEIIKRKTALLFRACCVGGAISMGASKEQVARVGDFGLNLGMVFQLRDDILDDDDPHTTAMAKTLLPEYLEKTMAALEAMTVSKDLNVELLESLRALSLFCAERSH